MLVMPADHIIEPAQEFRRAVQIAEQLAEEHPKALITFGVPPGLIESQVQLALRYRIRLTD